MGYTNFETLEMSLNEYERWETRYALPEYAFGKDPNYFLASCKTLLPKSGRVVTIAEAHLRLGHPLVSLVDEIQSVMARFTQTALIEIGQTGE